MLTRPSVLLDSEPQLCEFRLVFHLHICKLSCSAHSRVLILLKTELESLWTLNWLLRRVIKSCCFLHLCIHIGLVLLQRERDKRKERKKKKRKKKRKKGAVRCEREREKKRKEKKRKKRGCSLCFSIVFRWCVVTSFVSRLAPLARSRLGPAQYHR